MFILRHFLLIALLSVFFAETKLVADDGTQVMAAGSKKHVEQEYSDAINEKFKSITENISKISDKAKDKNSIFTEKQKKFLADANERAQRTRKRANDEGGFKMMSHKKTFDKNKGNKTPDPNDPNDTEFDEETAQDMLGGLDDVNNVLGELNSQVQVRQQILAYASAGPNTPNKCANVLKLNRQFTDADVIGTHTAANALSMSYDICDSACNQDSFGWNCSAVCVGLAIAKGVLECVSDGLEMSDDSVTSARIDASCECLEQLGTNLTATMNQLGDATKKIDELQNMVTLLGTKIDNRFDAVETLLNTPQGRRASFPIKK